MIIVKRLPVIVLISMLAVWSSCKKESGVSVKLPELSTTALTNITATGAVSGGTITSNGGAEITTAGLAWSKTTQTPTISDDTTKSSVTSGSFTSEIKNLDPGSTYYIRAYAINSAGVGYGNILTLATGNAPPEAKNITVTGIPTIGSTLAATYTYFDFEGNGESGTNFQWYRANDANGTGEIAVNGATALTYLIVSADQDKFLRIGITPKSSAGTLTGTETKSSFSGPVNGGTEPTTVTFTYNGQEVTYGILTSTTTGRKWLDRNLGAFNSPSAFDNYTNYGDLFQWGRDDDGHQVVSRTSADPSSTTWVGSAATAKFPNPPQLSTADNPGHGLFIINSSDMVPQDWRNPHSDNLWQGVNGINNPCPDGWRLPTKQEFEAEGLIGDNKTLDDEAFVRLKFTLTGSRDGYSESWTPNEAWNGLPVKGYYWTSTIGTGAEINRSFQVRMEGVDGEKTVTEASNRIVASACRCIKD